MASSGQPSLTALEDPWVDRLIWRALKRGAGPLSRRLHGRRWTATGPKMRSTRRWSGSAARADDRSGARRLRNRPGAHPTTRLSLASRDFVCSARATARTGAPALSRSDRRAARPVARPLRLRLLLDCHSMPPPAAGVAQMVFGDCRGRTADGWISRMRWPSPRVAVSRRAQRSFRRRSRDRSPRTAGARQSTRSSSRSTGVAIWARGSRLPAPASTRLQP